jgi:hypothetical protein
MKTEVYSWRLSAQRKADLEAEAHREGTSISSLLDQVTADWLAERRNGHSDDEAQQAALHQRVMDTVGTIRSDEPSRSERTSELVREIIYKKHVKESNALKRRLGRRTD